MLLLIACVHKKYWPDTILILKYWGPSWIINQPAYLEPTPISHFDGATRVGEWFFLWQNQTHNTTHSCYSSSNPANNFYVDWCSVGEGSLLKGLVMRWIMVTWGCWDQNMASLKVKGACCWCHSSHILARNKNIQQLKVATQHLSSRVSTVRLKRFVDAVNRWRVEAEAFQTLDFQT